MSKKQKTRAQLADELGALQQHLIESEAATSEQIHAGKVQAALYRISEAAHTAEDLDELYRMIHSIIAELMPADNFYIALYDDSMNLLSFPYYADQEDTAPAPQKPGHGLTEYVLHSGQPLLATPEIFEQLLAADQVERIGAASVDWLGVPLKVHRETIGMMALQSYTPQIRYSKADLEVLIFVSAQVAMAIERKRAAEALGDSEKRYRMLFENAPVGIFLTNPKGDIVEVNSMTLQILGSPSVEATRAINVLTYSPLIEVGFSANIQRCLDTGQPVTSECLYTSKWGKPIYVQYYLNPILDGNGKVFLVQALLENITERQRAEGQVRLLNQNLQRRANELSSLNRAGQAMTATLELEPLLRLLIEQSMSLLEGEGVIVAGCDPALEQADDQLDPIYDLILMAVAGLGPEYTQGLRIPVQGSIAGRVIQEKRGLIITDFHNDPRFLNHLVEVADRRMHSLLAVPLMARGKVFGVVEVMKKTAGAFEEHDQDLLEALCGSAAIAFENARLLAETNQRAEQLSLLYEAGLTLNRTLDIHEQLETLCKIVMQTLRADHSGFFQYDSTNEEIYYEFGVGRLVELDALHTLRVHIGEERGLLGWIAQKRELFYLPDVTRDARWLMVDPEIRSCMWIPIQREDQLLGLLSVASTRLNAFTRDDQQLFKLLANQVAVSMLNAQLYKTAVDAAERRMVLHWLSQEIVSASLEPERIYRTIHQAVSRLMPAESFMLALKDDSNNDIELAYLMERGQRYPSQHIPRQSGLSGRVISSGKSLIISDLDQEAQKYNLVHIGEGPLVRSILAVPMRLGDQVIGVLSSQSYEPNAFTVEDTNLLETLAASTAIAIENSRLFTQMQASHLDLVQAYESTIAGWSRALEMRDKETKGHSERVSRASLLLARVVGMPDAKIVHFRRGVLLHDIGKMAIPDSILFKPGSLTEDEWITMRQHPVYAYQMLQDIPFLKEALDVPYSHHEKWDGSGYPHGLQGEQIPLGARIFAVVDVWDALMSDRPYRSRWVPEVVRANIQAQSGIHFDPKVVAEFLKLLDAGVIQNLDV